MQSTAKVGALVVVFVILLGLAFNMLGSSLMRPAKETYYAEFPNAAGVREGTPVQLAGVKKGEVVQVSLVNPRLARLTLELDKGTPVPTGSTATIPGSLIGIGESQVSIDPPATGGSTLMPPGSTLPGKMGNALENLLPGGEAAVQELTATLKAVRGVLEDEKLMAKLDSLIASTDKTMQNVGMLAGRTDQLLATNQAGLSLALQRVNRSLMDANRITLQVAKMAEDPRLREDAMGILGNVREATLKVDRLLGDVGTMMNDPSLREPFSRSAANVAEITETGKRIAANTETMTANGAVISEKAIGVTEQVSQIASQATDIANDVKQLTQRVSGILNPAPRPGMLSQLEFGMDLMRESDPGYWRADFNAALPFRDSRLHFGLYDAFESNRFTLQLGNQVSDQLAYRYGIYGGRAGVGVDYQVASKMSLRGDFWDLNNPRLDLRARYNLGNGVIGWIGVDRLFNDNAPTIGIGVRR